MDKSINTYRLSKEELINEMYQYFNTVFREKTISVDETMRFLRFYLEYVFRLNHLDSRDYAVTIHAVDIEEQDICAYMEHTGRGNRYDVYLNKSKMTIIKPKTLNDRRHSRGYLARRARSKEYAQALRIAPLFDIIIEAGHEFRHRVQYIRNKASLTDYDIKCDEIYSTILNVTKAKTKTQNKKAGILQFCLDRLHPIERDADWEAYKYCRYLLEDINQYCIDNNAENNFVDMGYLEACYNDSIDEVITSNKNTYKQYLSNKEYFTKHNIALNILD